MTIPGAAGLAAAAFLVVLAAGCGASGGTAGTGASQAPAASVTAAPSALASTPVTTAPGTQSAVPRCRTSQLTAAYTGLNAAMGGTRGVTLVLNNHSGGSCYVYGYPGLAFFNGGGLPMATHLTWMTAPRTKVVMHPDGNARAMLTWRVNVDAATPFSPSFAHVTPPDEHAYLTTLWQGGPVLGGNIVSWPLEAAPAGPFPAGTGTIGNPFNGLCAALAVDGVAVTARKCDPGAASQRWTGYNDGTLRVNGKCLDVTSPRAGATVNVTVCTGAATQAWAIGQVSGNDFGPITNKATGYVLTGPASSTANGARLVAGQSRGDLSYPWRVSYHYYVAG